MNKSLSFLLCLLVLLPAGSCDKQAEPPRTDALLTVEKPVKVSDLTLPGLVRTSAGSVTVFDVAADMTSGAFHLCAGDIRKGAGDATYLVKGKAAPK